MKKMIFISLKSNLYYEIRLSGVLNINLASDVDES